MRSALRLLSFFLILCFCRGRTEAQLPVWLELIPADTFGQEMQQGDFLIVQKKKIPLQQRIEQGTAVRQKVQDLLNRLIEEGYLAASLDSLVYRDSLIRGFLFVGKQYRWSRLSFDKIPVSLLNAADLRKRDWEGQQISPKKVSSLLDKILRYCENNGFPFAKVFLANIREEGSGLYAELELERGLEVRIDSIIVESDVELAKGFLENYLGIHEGDLYNEGQLRMVSKKLSELTFLQEYRPWQVSFSVMKNELRLFLKEKKSNQLNGLIGLQPNTIETGKFMLTYDILLGLKNALGYGESIAATIQQLQYKTLRFHADAYIPYILGTPFGLEGSFDLFNRDTSFVRISFDGGVRYQFNATDYIKVSYQTFSNRIIDADVRFVQLNKRLPDNLDVSTRGAGMLMHMDRTDYKLNPRKGWQGHIVASGLFRNVKKNDAITGIEDGSGFDYASLYDTVNSNRYQYRLLADGAFYLPLFRNAVLRLGYNGGYVSGGNLFLNELFQLGGFKLLRGFDEQSIYANQYHIGTIELRVLLGQNSFFYLFNDNGFIQTQYNKVDKIDYPVSIGGGVTLENKSGIFNIALGLGKLSGQDFQFRQSRIHFGYTAYF